MSDYCSTEIKSIVEHNKALNFTQTDDGWEVSNFVQRKNDFIEVAIKRICVPPREMDGFIEES